MNERFTASEAVFTEGRVLRPGAPVLEFDQAGKLVSSWARRRL
jgi:hypothetical protein